jgi:RNA polymerase sigma-70 factor (ECF subfamily)
VKARSGRARSIRSELRQARAFDYEKLSDPILVTRAKDGDRLALEALCARHAPKVERLARHLLRDPEDARDAAQEALAKLCVRLRQFRGEAQFSTWLHRLVVNTCRDVADRQRTRTHEPLPEEFGVDLEHDPTRGVRMSELRRELCDSLAGISPEQAQVIVLKDALGYTFEETRPRPAPVGMSAQASGTQPLPGAARRPRRRVSLPPNFGRRRSSRSSRIASVPARRRGPRLARPARARPLPRPRGRLVVPGSLPRPLGMPGVLTIEAIAQCGAVESSPTRRTGARSCSSCGSTTAASSVVELGDVLDLECEFVRVRGPIAKGQGRASVADETAGRRRSWPRRSEASSS